MKNLLRLRTGKVVLVAAMLILLSACESGDDSLAEDAAEPVRPARIFTVTNSQQQLVRTFPGIIDSNKKTDLAFRVPGQLIELPSRPGDIVQAGSVLAKLDPTDYQNALDERTAQLNLIKTQHQQIHALFKKKYASQAEVDSVNAQLKAAQVAERQARTNLGYTVLSAPFTGIVGRVNVENHQSVQTLQTIVQLQNHEGLDVGIDVPESLIKSLKRSDAYLTLCGTVSFMTRDGRSPPLEACYKEHDTVADSLTRSYRALFTLKDAESAYLLPGMSVDFALDLSPLEKASRLGGYLVPVESVFDENDKQWVWKLNDEWKVSRQEVVVAELSGEMVRLTAGLAEGERIVAAGVSYLQEGQQVKPLTKERGL